MSSISDTDALQRAQRIWEGNATDPVPIWLDCDTGHDDAFAILLCAICPRFNLLGISTVHGNASLENTTINTLSILEAIGRRDVPVYAGAAKPFCREAAHAESIHGVSGLDGTTVLPAPVASAKQHPQGTVTAIYEALAAHPGKAYLVSTGSLANIGLLFAAHPDLAGSIAGLSIMGGAVGGLFTNAPMGKTEEYVELKSNVYEHFPAGLSEAEGMSISQVAQKFKELGIIDPESDVDDEKVGQLLEQARTNFGNWSPYAEFNIYCDPEAASSIFTNPVLTPKTTLIPLDLTHQVLATPAILDLLKHGHLTPSSSSSSSSAAVVEASSESKPVSTTRLLFNEILTYFATTYARQFGAVTGPPLHDPVAVAAILAPELFDDRSGERFGVVVVRSGEEDAVVVVGQKRRKGGKVGQCGRTVVQLLQKGEAGVRIPRAVDTGAFWHLLNLALEKVEAQKMI